MEKVKQEHRAAAERVAMAGFSVRLPG